MKEGTSMEMHLKRMKEITDKLAGIGAPFSEEDQVVTLLGSLPPSYCTLVTALEARVDDITLGFVQQALIHEEQKLSGQFGHPSSSLSDDQSDLALVGVQKKTRPRKLLKCFGCGEVRRFHRDCPQKSQERSRPAHKAETAEEKSSNSDSDGVFAASANPGDSSWKGKGLVDSEASSHMTWEKEMLIDYQEFAKPEKVGLR